MEPKFINSLRHPKIEGFEWQEPENQYDRELYKDILNFGCRIVQVTPDDDPVPPFDFCYTIGFYLNLKHPEFIILGATNLVGRLMNGLFAEIENGKSYGPDDAVTFDFGRGPVDLRLREVPQGAYFEYMGYASWFYRSLLYNVSPLMEHKFPVLQLCWPDPAGRYPWEEECNPKVIAAQTFKY